MITYILSVTTLGHVFGLGHDWRNEVLYNDLTRNDENIEKSVNSESMPNALKLPI